MPELGWNQVREMQLGRIAEQIAQDTTMNRLADRDNQTVEQYRKRREKHPNYVRKKPDEPK